MTIYTQAQLDTLRDTISGLVEHLQLSDEGRLLHEAVIAVKPVEAPKSKGMMGWMRDKAAAMTKSVPKAEPTWQEQLATAKENQAIYGENDPYTLTRFIIELSKIRAFQLRRLPDILKQDYAVTFIWPHVPPTHIPGERLIELDQTRIDADAKAKLALLANGSITLDDIKAIEHADHPLLDSVVIQRMFTEKTTLADEIKLWKMQKEAVALIGDLFVSGLHIQFDRIKGRSEAGLLDNSNNKASKFSKWLRDAQTAFRDDIRAGRAVPQDRYDFYKQFSTVVGEKETEKNIIDLLSQKIYGVDSKTPTSVLKITALRDILDKALLAVKGPALHQLALELKLAEIFYCTDVNVGARATKLKQFFAANPDFKLGYVPLNSGKFVLQSELLRTLLHNLPIADNKVAYAALLKEIVQASGQQKAAIPAVTWADIQKHIDAYHGVKRNFSPHANISRVIEPLEAIVTEHGRNLDTPLTGEDKAAVVAIIHGRYEHSKALATDDPTKQKKSQKTCSDIINTLYGMQGADDELMHLIVKPKKAEVRRGSLNAFTRTLEEEFNDLDVGEVDTVHDSFDASSMAEFYPVVEHFEAGLGSIENQMKAMAPNDKFVDVKNAHDAVSESKSNK